MRFVILTLLVAPTLSVFPFQLRARLNAWTHAVRKMNISVDGTANASHMRSRERALPIPTANVNVPTIMVACTASLVRMDTTQAITTMTTATAQTRQQALTLSVFGGLRVDLSQVSQTCKGAVVNETRTIAAIPSNEHPCEL